MCWLPSDCFLVVITRFTNQKNQCRVNLNEIKAKLPATGGRQHTFKDPHFKTSELEWYFCEKFLTFFFFFVCRILEPKKEVYLNGEWRYVCPDTQCVLTGVFIRKSDDKPDYMGKILESTPLPKWVFIK